jgi:hypothetical protein
MEVPNWVKRRGMKVEGRKMIRFPGKRDVHPKRGWVNWWENIGDYISRNTRKQNLKKEIENDTRR